MRKTRHSPVRPGPASRPSTTAPILLALTAATFLAFSNSLSGPPVFDDIPAIAENPHITSPWPPAAAMKAPPDTTVSGRPMVSLSLAISRAFGDPSTDGVRAFHVTNLLIHWLAGLTLFGIVRRTLMRPAFGDDVPNAAAPLAGAIALLWLVHPLQTSAVTYLVQRAESLMGLFFLLTLYSAIRAHDTHSRGWSAAAIAACALGMASKEVMAPAPLVVVAWDRCFGRKRPALYAALACTWVVLALCVWSAPRSAAAGFGFAEWPWWRYLATQAGVILHYVRLAVAPSPLVFDYGWPAARSVAAWAPQVLLVGVAATLTAVGMARRIPGAFAGAWFFLILAPTSSVLPIVTEVAAEHRMYLPLAAIVAILVVTAYARGRRMGVPAWAGYAAVAAAAVALASLTYARNADYASEESLWHDTVVKRPGSPRARINYGVTLLARGRTADAEPHLREAVALDPSDEDAHLGLGAALCMTDRCDEGIRHFERAAELDPLDPKPARNLAEAHASHGRMPQAAAEYRRALTLAPGHLFTLNQASWLMATAEDPRARDPETARQYAERAVALTGGRDATSLESLGVAHAALGRFPEAAAAMREAIAAARAAGQHQRVPGLEERLRVIDERLRGVPPRAPAR